MAHDPLEMPYRALITKLGVLYEQRCLAAWRDCAAALLDEDQADQFETGRSYPARRREPARWRDV
jgi:hypothetical protein